MNDTAITLTPEMKARLAPGHNNRYEPTPNWDLPTLAGAERCVRLRQTCSRFCQLSWDTKAAASIQQ